ncbi:MAG: hypothetical protein CMJ84_14710 [Planctomycetes bacterium]|nr:hypothetical protein [Planctomycetota bacterium]MDP6409316.1 hypothetical protein [Planctomycetota bacterium]
MKRLLALTLAAAASCSSPSVSVTPYLAQNSLDGSVASSTDGASGSTSVEALGVDGEESVLGGRIDVRGDHSHLSLSYTSTDLSATGGILSDDIEIDGTTIDSDSVSVDTDLDIAATNAMWTYDWNIGETAFFGLGLGVTALDLSIALTGAEEITGLIVTATLDETLPVPLIAARAGGEIGPVWIEGSYALLSVSVDEAEVEMSDLDVSAGLKILGDTGSIVVGYRMIDFDAAYDVDSDSIDLDLAFGGPYAGVRLGF